MGREVLKQLLLRFFDSQATFTVVRDLSFPNPKYLFIISWDIGNPIMPIYKINLIEKWIPNPRLCIIFSSGLGMTKRKPKLKGNI